MRVPDAPYPPEDALRWFERFHYEREVPDRPETFRDRRALLVARNPVSNQAPGVFDDSDRNLDRVRNDLLDEARTGVVTFAGGELRISPTPAMTLIDVDGYLEPDELAVLGAAEAARAIRRLDIGGSIGIDLPTASGKAARQAAAAAIDGALPRPFERTAVNGFGFVQIVRPAG